MSKKKRWELRLEKIVYLYNSHKVPDHTVLWILQNGVSIDAPDFQGYIFKVDPRHRICGLFSTNGDLLFMSTNAKRPQISLYRLRRTFKKLRRNNFLEYNTPEVFEEYAMRNNVPFDLATARREDKCIFLQDKIEG